MYNRLGCPKYRDAKANRCNPIVADEIEFSDTKFHLGLHCKSGRWVTYNTPMDGVRRASAHDIVFQAREGSSELTVAALSSAWSRYGF